MSVILRLAKSEDQQRCSELLDVLAKATSDSHEIFDLQTFEHLISNERGSLVVAEESGNVLGMASISFNLALRYNGEYCQLEELVVDPDARGKNVGGLLIEEIHYKPDVKSIVEIIRTYKGEIIITSNNQKDVPEEIKKKCKISRL